MADAQHNGAVRAALNQAAPKLYFSFRLNRQQSQGTGRYIRVRLRFHKLKIIALIIFLIHMPICSDAVCGKRSVKDIHAFHYRLYSGAQNIRVNNTRII